MAAIDLKEIGITGAPMASPDATSFHFAGTISDRYLVELQGPAGVKAMARVLRREPAAYTLQRAILLAAGQAAWTVTTSDGSSKGGPAIDFLRSCMDDMSQSWWKMIKFALSAQAFGFADAEIVYKRRLGDQSGKLPSSKYNDGLIGLRKVAPRRQETVTWRFDQNGGPSEMVQLDPNTGEPRPPIPVDKLLHFQSGDDRDGWEGLGWLEPAYQLAHRISNYEMILAIGHQRAHVGLPVFAYKSNPDAELRKSTENLARGLVVNTNQYVTYPEQAIDFKLMSVTNNNAAELRALIDQSRWEIMSLGLAQFLRLGNTSSGSRALAETLINLFINSINAALNEIAETLNRHLVPRLLAANPSLKGDGDVPKFSHGGVKSLPMEILRYLAGIKDFMLTADPQDEEWIRTLTGLPSISTLSKESIAFKDEMRKMLLAQAAAKTAGAQANGSPNQPANNAQQKNSAAQPAKGKAGQGGTSTSNQQPKPKQSSWRIDEENWLISPAGTKIAQVINGALYLYDKRAHIAIPFTEADWYLIVQAN